jgi:hypothetical protein
MNTPSYSILDQSGKTTTAKLMHDFAGIYVSAIKEHFSDLNLAAKLHSFRKGDVEGLKLTIHTVVSVNNPFEIIIFTDRAGPAIDENNAYLTDMSEAIHFVGIITTALNTPLKAGSLKLENNKEVTASDTSSIMNLWR